MKLYLIVILLLLFIVASCCNNKPVEHFANNDQKELSSADKLKVDKLAEKWETAWKPVIKEAKFKSPHHPLEKKTLDSFLKLLNEVKPTSTIKSIEGVKYSDMKKGISKWMLSSGAKGPYKAVGSISLWTHLGGKDSDAGDSAIEYVKGMFHSRKHVPKTLAHYFTVVVKEEKRVLELAKAKALADKAKTAADKAAANNSAKSVVKYSCKGPPACKKATKTLDRDGKQTFKRCKSGCGTKIPKLGYICCDKGCCNKKSVETDTVKTAVKKTTENIKELSNIGQNLDTSNSVNASSVSASSTQNTIENKKEISDLKKQIAKQNKKIENLDAKVINSNDKYFASVKNRDSKLIEANDGTEPIDPGSFSFKPEIKFDHKQPDPKIASSYGWSFMPPQFWSVPQKRPPSCVPSKQNTATVTPIYDKSVPVDALDYTQVGSMLPKFKYKEIYNPDYYYPGYIAKKDEPYPGKNGRKVMKTGEYYNMKLARPTGLEPRKGIKFGKTIIDDNVVPHKAIRKKLDRSLPRAKPGKNKRARPGCGIIKGNPALSHHCNNAKMVPKSKCKSGCSTTIRGLGSVCCKTKCCTAQPKSVAKKVRKSGKAALNKKTGNSKPLDKEQSAHEKNRAKQVAEQKKMVISIFKKADANNDTKVTKSEALKFYEKESRLRMPDKFKGKSEAEIKELVKKDFESVLPFFLDDYKFPPNTVEISFNKFIKHLNDVIERENKERAATEAAFRTATAANREG